MATATVIGLDIGSTCIRAVETRRSKEGHTLTNFGQVPLVPGTVAGGVVHDDKAVTHALRQLWTTTRFSSREVVLGVTNPQVVVREVTVNHLPGSQLRASLALQVRDALPLPVEKCVLDFYPLEESSANKTVRGLLVAAPKEAVLTLVRAVEAAGLRVAGVDLASFALLRATSRLDAHVEAIVDVGARSTSVVVHADGQPLIVRTVPRGGEEITEAIAKQLHIAPGEAEALKCRVGLRSANPAQATVVEDAIRPLISEVRGSFSYLASGERQTRVHRMLLCGGGAYLPGFAERLGTELGVEVHLADPMVRLRDPRRSRHNGLEQFRPSAAVSVGLTLGAAR